MSILQPVLIQSLLLVLWMGVAMSHRSHGNDAEAPANGPIALAEARRICASLCISGLGGKPCGEACSSIEPANFTSQSAAATLDGGVAATTRRDACPLLCQYQLGEPLCKCPDFPVDIDAYKVDFHRICAYFCIVHRYHIYGCRSCDVYQRPPYMSMESMVRRVRPTEMEIDWEQWCRDKCKIGDGGAACNCDLLPLPMMASKNLTRQVQIVDNADN